MAEYGGYILASGGALSDPEWRTRAEARLRDQFRETQKTLGRVLQNFQFIAQEQVEKWPISEKSMREFGWTEDEIKDTLAWQETQEWPKYQDCLAWKAEG